jgi:NitT/TauT family transport system ATP-binding protein
VSEPFSVRIEEKSFLRADGEVLPVLRGLAFDLRPGSFTCLLGPSGCGKTTTLRIMLGLDADFAGTLAPNLKQARSAVVFQEPRLLPWRSVEQNIRLALPPALKGRDILPPLRSVGLEGFERAYPGELSLGMARRAALARAFAVEPELLLLDEPFVSLDESAADRLRELLLALWQASPVTVLLVTHNVREALRLADRLLVLSERPAHLLGAMELKLDRAARHGPALDALADDLLGRFPSLGGGA